jgi:hypothetical protein
MLKQHPVSSATSGGESHPVPKPEIDYAPKEHSLGETLRYGWKFFAAAGIFIVICWLIETYLY